MTGTRHGRAARGVLLAAVLCLWATAGGSAAPGSGSEGVTPRQQVAEFFQTIIRGDAAKAFDTLLAGSGAVANRPNASYSLRNQLLASVSTYGKPTGYDFVEQKDFGASLVRLIYILRLEKYPLTWEFFFYDNGSAVLPIDVHFNDRLDVYRYDRVPSANNGINAPAS